MFKILQSLFAPKLSGAKCPVCGQIHAEFSLAFSEPYQISQIAVDERQKRVELYEDICVLDNETFFIRATLEMPIAGLSQPFSWGIWVTQSRENFETYINTFEQDQSDIVTFGWMTASFEPFLYPSGEIQDLKSDVVWGGVGSRPKVTLHTDQDHALVRAQVNGLTHQEAVNLLRRAI